MAIKWRNLIAVAAGALAAGCLVKDTTHTWYLEPETGQVTWSVMDQHVRSDAKAQADRLREEREFWTGVETGSHAVARGFRELGAQDVLTRAIRDRVPYGIVTEATFPTIGDLGRRLLPALGLTGSSRLERDGAAMEWTMTVRDPHAEDTSPSDAMMELAAAFESLRIVLVDGRFESASGFTLESDRRVAHFAEPDDDEAVLVLRLRWTPWGAGALAPPSAPW